MYYIVKNAFRASGKQYSRGEEIPAEIALTWRNLELMKIDYLVQVDDDE